MEFLYLSILRSKVQKVSLDPPLFPAIVACMIDSQASQHRQAFHLCSFFEQNNSELRAEEENFDGLESNQRHSHHLAIEADKS